MTATYPSAFAHTTQACENLLVSRELLSRRMFPLLVHISPYGPWAGGPAPSRRSAFMSVLYAADFQQDRYRNNVMHISEKLAEARRAGRRTFSFEFFPPKTAQGVQNLYDRIDRMHDLGPAFIDVTWGAGGRLSHLTCEMVKVAQSVYGLETCMHLTCTDMGRAKIDEALRAAYNAGCTNILALRGDPPREKEKWVAAKGGFTYAKDLVKYITDTYGNHFDIGVAGYPEGCDDNEDAEELIDHLKEKVDAGATFVVTQMFYNVDIFLDWVKRCRAKGIGVPIIPGIMPIHTHAAFLRRANWTKCDIPAEWTQALEPVKHDDAVVREVGKNLVVQMCQRMFEAGITHFHLYVDRGPRVMVVLTTQLHDESCASIENGLGRPRLASEP